MHQKNCLDCLWSIKKYLQNHHQLYRISRFLKPWLTRIWFWIEVFKPEEVLDAHLKIAKTIGDMNIRSTFYAITVKLFLSVVHANLIQMKISTNFINNSYLCILGTCSSCQLAAKNGVTQGKCSWFCMSKFNISLDWAQSWNQRSNV